jgi:secreted trypsin-like serine protease
VSKDKGSSVFYCTYILFQGDTGAPLVYNNKLVGLYVGRVSCGNPDFPDLYTKVSAVCDWIVSTTELYRISAVVNWIETLPGLETMPRSNLATYSND